MPTLPVRKPSQPYRTLEEIRQRKEQLYDELQHDNQQFNTLWSQIFVKRKESTRSEFITSMISNGITAIDAFLLIRKLLKGYKGIVGKKRK